MVLSIICLEDKHKIVLHLSIFYEYQQFFQHRICFPITNETSNVTTHATRSDPWPTLARSTSLFLICCYNYIYELFIVVIAWHALTLMYGKCCIYCCSLCNIAISSWLEFSHSFVQTLFFLRIPTDMLIYIETTCCVQSSVEQSYLEHI